MFMRNVFSKKNFIKFELANLGINAPQYVKFDEKLEGDVAVPVPPTVWELFPNVVQKCCHVPAEMVPPKF